MSEQLWTIVGVVLGGGVSVMGALVTDRSRWKRDRLVRWDQRTLDAYSQFAGAIKRELRVTMRIAGGRGLGPRTEPLALPEGARLHQEAEQERSYCFESLLLVGAPDAVRAAREWQHAVWDLYRYVVEVPDATEDGYTALYAATGAARERFHTAARESLGFRGQLASAVAPTLLSSAERRY